MTNIQEKKVHYKDHFNKEDWSSAYQNVEQEFDDIEIKLSRGNSFKELNGTLLRNGPGILKRKDQWVHHPFDGDGMVTAIKFKDGKVLSLIHI